MTPREFQKVAGTVAAFAIFGLALVFIGMGFPAWLNVLTCVCVGAIAACAIVNKSRFL
jgi:hypothetical protein